MKKYNPFKMWGTWLGGIILLVSGYFLRIGLPLPYPFTLQSWMWLTNIIDYVFFFIMGFLLGWGIHSLVRFIKRK